MKPVVLHVGGVEVWSHTKAIPIDVGDEIEFRTRTPEGVESWHVVRVTVRRWWISPVLGDTVLHLEGVEVPQ